jgi:predicted transcriptional regulator
LCGELTAGNRKKAMAQTTIAIDEDLLRRIEEKAARESRTAEEVANELLRKSLDAAKPYKLELKGWDAELQPGIDLTDRDKLYDILDGPDEMKRRGF